MSRTDPPTTLRRTVEQVKHCAEEALSVLEADEDIDHAINRSRSSGPARGLRPQDDPGWPIAMSTFRPDLARKCPFCGGKFEAGYFSTQAPSGSVVRSGGVLHSVPHCKTFEDLDPPDFLKAVRLRGLS